MNVYMTTYEYYEEELCGEAVMLGRKKWGKKCVRKGQVMIKVYYQEQRSTSTTNLWERKVKKEELHERKERRKCTKS